MKIHYNEETDSTEIDFENGILLSDAIAAITIYQSDCPDARKIALQNLNVQNRQSFLRPYRNLILFLSLLLVVMTTLLILRS